MTTQPSDSFRILYVGRAGAPDQPLEADEAFYELTVQRVPTAGRALDIVEEADVDAVVSEHDLPDTTGLDLFRSLLSLAPDLPFVLFTDAGDEHLASRAVGAGVDGYVPKDRGVDTLVDQLGEALDAPAATADESERRYRELVRTSPAPINLFDASGEIIYGNDAVLDLLGLDSRADLVGRSIFEFIYSDDQETAEVELERVVTEGVSTGPTQMQVVRPDGERRDIQVSTAPGEYGGEPIGQAVVTDVTDLLGTQRELREERRFVDSALDTLGDVFYVVGTEGELLRWNEQLPAVTGYTDAELDGMDFRTLVVGADLPTVRDSFERVLEGNEEVIDVRIVTKGGDTVPFEARSRRLETADGDVVGLVGIGRVVSERREREAELEHQRERLALLNRTNAIIRDVNAALVTAESRSAIESAVCEQFAETGPYRFAWVGALDRGHEEVVPRAWAGVEQGYLDTITVTVDDDSTGRGPVGRAVRTGEVQTNAVADSEFEPWREAAEARGYARETAIPITYDDVTYGVLVLYSGTGDGLHGVEPSVLGELGQTIGAAINAAARKRALVGDPGVELEFVLRDETEFFNRLAAAVDASVNLEKVTPLDGGSYNVYLSVDAATDRVEAVCDRFQSVASWSLLTERDGGCVVELNVSEPLIVDLLATHGSVLVSLTATPDSCVLEAELPTSADVRSFVETLRRNYREVDLRAHRERTARRRPHLGLRYEELLTERQQEVLESAYFAGYFEEPRETPGVDIAAALGISGPTFHHHLRSAQRRLLTELFTSRPDDD